MSSVEDDAQPQVPFGIDEAAAVVAACRESIADIGRSCASSDGEYHPGSDDPAILPLGRIAFHAAEAEQPEPPESELDMHYLKIALKLFSDEERTKKAVGESVLRFGVLNNPEIEQRVTLGAVAGRLLRNIDPEFAGATMEEAQKRFLFIDTSADPVG